MAQHLIILEQLSSLRTGAVNLSVLSLHVNYSPSSCRKGSGDSLPAPQYFMLMRFSGSLLNTLVLVVTNFSTKFPCLGRQQHLSVWQARLTVGSTNGVEHSSLRYQVAGI